MNPSYREQELMHGGGPPMQNPPAGIASIEFFREPLNNMDSPPTAPVVMVISSLPPESSRYVCPSCQANIQTRVEHKSGTMTHIIALLLCLFGCWCCAPIPYCIESCRDAYHYCPACAAYLGTSARD
ncbi:lipopolysaccharide-induced tumor necrosis factor-alpha factor homolog [Neocloeon triangulifer]|uniref:lipopolysaccharide-induced tumor necrosis factor-alpha factor homolog n=1 Tax=Neocloeon triangulifer TaxID=2078957 RepID=UPI00286F7316|nr:lipopolysaccharide-induced tumor necrosis factor-alpha factor homolog [Neocloeon triangulifer]